jgi:hypothetical protein
VVSGAIEPSARGIALLLMLLACSLAGVGCATRKEAPVLEGPVAVISRHEQIPISNAASKSWQEGVRALALTAWFSAVVYRDFKDPKDPSSSSGCDPSRPEAGMPNPTDARDGWRWSRWSHWTDGVDLGCIDEDGLYAEVYVLSDGGGPPKAAVLAYRGTEEWNSRAGVLDWLNNLAITGEVEPYQYTVAQRRLFQLVEAFDKTGPGWGKVPIFAVGHSLGGGLAQQAAYLSPRVNAAIVFNTSPRTNWSNLKRKEDWWHKKGAAAASLNSNAPLEPGQLDYASVPPGFKVVSDPAVVRVHHDKEVLEGLREVTTRVTKTLLNRADVELRFETGKEAARSALAAHGINRLVCSLFMRLGTDMSETRETVMVEELGKRTLPAYLLPDVVKAELAGESFQGANSCRDMTSTPRQ